MYHCFFSQNECVDVLLNSALLNIDDLMLFHCLNLCLHNFLIEWIISNHQLPLGSWNVYAQFLFKTLQCKSLSYDQSSLSLFDIYIYIFKCTVFSCLKLEFIVHHHMVTILMDVEKENQQTPREKSSTLSLSNDSTIYMAKT